MESTVIGSIWTGSLSRVAFGAADHELRLFFEGGVTLHVPLSEQTAVTIKRLAQALEARRLEPIAPCLTDAPYEVNRSEARELRAEQVFGEQRYNGGEPLTTATSRERE